MAQGVSKTRVLGIDPGLATVGYAVVEARAEGRRCELAEAGVITTPPADDTTARLRHLYEETGALVAQYAPQVLAIETLFFKQNVTTGIAVAQARGVLLLAACGLAVHEYAPVEVKRRVAGSGRAQKVQIQAMIQRLLGLRAVPKPDDAADAVAIALCYLLEQRTPAARAQALAKGRHE